MGRAEHGQGMGYTGHGLASAVLGMSCPWLVCDELGMGC
jgi:hypothetical protein